MKAAEFVVRSVAVLLWVFGLPFDGGSPTPILAVAAEAVDLHDTTPPECRNPQQLLEDGAADIVSTEECVADLKERRKLELDPTTANPAASSLFDTTCTLWASHNDGWILPNKAIRRHEPVPGLRPDVVIPWKQHSRKAFPLWGRNNFFYRNISPKQPTNVDTTTNQTASKVPSDNTNDLLFFAPGLHFPLECHPLYSNLDMDYNAIFTAAARNRQSDDDGTTLLSPQIVTNRAVAAGDPLFMPCEPHTEWPVTQTTIEYDEFPSLHDTTTKTLMTTNASLCMDPFRLEIRPSLQTIQSSLENGTTAGLGTFAGLPIRPFEIVAFGRFIHMHRTELYDAQQDQYELLLNYCYGHSNSSLLFLPLVSMANTINHAFSPATPNVRVHWWYPTEPVENKFNKPSAKLFADGELSTILEIQYTSLRDIAVGEELLMDYGSEWEEAWFQHQSTRETAANIENDSVPPFRHEIGLPLDMLPAEWLANETLQNANDFDEWTLPTLPAYELAPVQLRSGQTISGQVDRIGLPINFTDSMAKWADDIGLTDIMRSYILGDLSLPAEGEQRLRLNGATWWIKRFPHFWRSDMHYISPDDAEANRQFMQALSDAGFDHVLNAVARQDGLDSITVYYPSFIAVSHCTGAHMHDDSSDLGHYNVIFPVLQANDPGPELVLGDLDKEIYASYKYERDHAVILGKDGSHGTAPCDYRGTNEMRMVVSAYMADTSNRITKAAVLKDWEDPPFPRPSERTKFFDTYKHWLKDDSSRSLTSPL